MLLAVERVALLRHVDIFARTPGRVLAGIAHVLEEVDFPAGATIIEAGAIEDWLLILVEGEVEVVRPDRRLRLYAGSVVGELEVLDTRPRSATITAITPVRAFRLGRDAFDEAIRLRPEIALGVIGELIAKLRETHQPEPTG